MNVWILVIVLHGWGAGVGSTGNAVTTQEFSSQEKCQAAVKTVVQYLTRENAAFCVEK